MLRRLTYSVSVEVLKGAYFGLVHSHLSYGTLLWGNASRVDCLFKLQKRAIRVLEVKKYNESCRALFRELEIMTLTLMFIYLHALKQKLNNIKDFRGSLHSYNIRNKSDINLPFRILTKSQQSPSYMSVKIFNKIPEEIKKLSLNNFKRKLNVFLITKSYYTIEEFLIRTDLFKTLKLTNVKLIIILLFV
ncbi:hypothetical protein O3M35_002299 [Rhynocoris fuscipes]|uniref:Maturase K n=1 Tax=Rhynocoris fuscipes TaxID=488301 RepID=A0AAW1CJT7_9HEMI